MCLRSQWSSMGVISIRVPARGGGTCSGRRGSWQTSGRILFWCQCLSLSLANPLTLSPWVDQSWLKQVHEIEEQIRGFHERWDRLAKEAEQAEEWEKVSNWVRDLLDQIVDLRVEIGTMELDLEQLKEERDRMQRVISGLGGAHQVAASSVSGKSQGASAGPRAPKKKKAKQKRHPGLPSQERQEYYKSYLANL